MECLCAVQDREQNMKLLNKLDFSKNNQLRRYIFVYTVVILFCLLCVFLFMGNLNNIWRSLQAKDELEVDQRAEYKKVVRLAGKQENAPAENRQKEAADIMIWGQGGGFKVASLQLQNMKEKFQVKEQLEDCGRAEILFVCRTFFQQDEIELLRRYNEAGMTLFFTNIPDAGALEDAGVRSLTGVERYKGMQKKTGIRLTEKLLFGSITENKEKFSLKAVTLKPQTEVYAAALEKGDVKSEDLSPVFWRYKRNVSCGSVYVADRQLMSGPAGYAAVSFLFTDLYQVYMYPVINAYCFAVSGMPYTDEFSSEFLDKEYERDSLGVQNDIFFPEFKRCEERYGTETTWYSTDKKKLKKTGNELLKYHLEGIEEKKDEIGTAGAEETVDSPFGNRLALWTSSFQWTDDESWEVCLPYNLIKDEKYDNVIFDNLGLCRGAGFNAVYADVKPFLREPEKKEEDDWVDFCRSMETVLGVEKEHLSWLERVTVGEAIYRVKAFDMMEPKIDYSGTRIEADIGNFTGRAYFYLSLPGTVKTVKNAELTKLYDGFYLVEAADEHVSIEYEEKER